MVFQKAIHIYVNLDTKTAFINSIGLLKPLTLTLFNRDFKADVQIL